MDTNVFINNREACSRATDGKSAGAFPDPCWSPPPPPTGPIVVPYSNTAYARDLQNGTATVFICKTMVAQKDRSFFSTSQGNEPATPGFQKGISSGVIKGKAYFKSWSPNVKFEGLEVPRHEDLMTHNHGSTQNTPPNFYMDSAFAKNKCAEDLRSINKKCKPEPKRSENDKRDGTSKNRKGIGQKLEDATKLLDDIGKKTAFYKRDSTIGSMDGNAWMDDHCQGMWIPPVTEFKKEYEDAIQDALNKIKEKKFRILMDSFGELKEIAIEKAGEAAVDKVFWFGVRSVIKGVVGIAGVESGIVPAAMTGWTIYDIASTAEELAELAGEKGKAAYDAVMSIKNIDEKAEGILKDYKKNPHRAHSDMMALLALVNPCLRARKCMLVPYENTTGYGSKPKTVQQANHGLGCCPGQTGHHILPDSMVANSGCPDYNKDKAITICLEGSKNGFLHGSHGMAHKKLSEAIKLYKKTTRRETISYQKAKELGIDAVRMAGAVHCRRDCLEAQLDSYYKGCSGKELNASAGT